MTVACARSSQIMLRALTVGDRNEFHSASKWVAGEMAQQARGAYCLAQGIELDPWDQYGQSREPTPADCPEHTVTHTCAHINKYNKE